jgi:hypothetical protein
MTSGAVAGVIVLDALTSPENHTHQSIAVFCRGSQE